MDNTIYTVPELTRFIGVVRDDQINEVRSFSGIQVLRSLSELRGSLPTQMLPTNVRLQVDLLFSLVVVIFLE